MTRLRLVGAGLTLALGAGAHAIENGGSAAAKPADASVVQAVAHGQINWTERHISATASATPDLSAPNVAVARVGAERVAKINALRNLVEAVRAMRLSGKESLGSRLDASPELAARVEAVMRNFRVLDTRYYADGGVDLAVQVPIDGALTEVVVPAKSSGPLPPQGAAESSASGVIVNAKGLGVLTPALAPRLTDEQGSTVYDASLVVPEVLRHEGVVSYTKSLDKALKDSRTGTQPLIVRALRPAEPASSDIVLAREDAAKLTGLRELLSQARVVIVCD